MTLTPLALDLRAPLVTVLAQLRDIVTRHKSVGLLCGLLQRGGEHPAALVRQITSRSSKEIFVVDLLPPDLNYIGRHNASASR